MLKRIRPYFFALTILALGVSLGGSAPLYAKEAQAVTNNNPTPLTFAHAADIHAGVHIDTWTGLLDGAAPLDNGVGLAMRIGVNAVTPGSDPYAELQWNIDLYLGGSVTSSPAKFGPGALEGGVKWAFYRSDPYARAAGDGGGHALAAGLQVSLPWAQSETRPALRMPPFHGYFEDSFTFQPALFYTWEGGSFALSLHGALDLLLLTDTSGSPINTDDNVELFLENSAGLAWRAHRRLQLSLEAASNTTLTGESSNVDLWVGPGVVWGAGQPCRLKAAFGATLLGDARDTLPGFLQLSWQHSF